MAKQVWVMHVHFIQLGKGERKGDNFNIIPVSYQVEPEKKLLFSRRSRFHDAIVVKDGIGQNIKAEDIVGIQQAVSHGVTADNGLRSEILPEKIRLRQVGRNRSYVDTSIFSSLGKNRKSKASYEKNCKKPNCSTFVHFITPYLLVTT
jgi:hypothetical protein